MKEKKPLIAGILKWFYIAIILISVICLLQTIKNITFASLSVTLLLIIIAPFQLNRVLKFTKRSMKQALFVGIGVLLLSILYIGFIACQKTEEFGGLVKFIALLVIVPIATIFNVVHLILLSNGFNKAK